MMILTLLELVLIVIWIFSLIMGQTFGGLSHILLGIAILLIISRLISGKNQIDDDI